MVPPKMVSALTHFRSRHQIEPKTTSGTLVLEQNRPILVPFRPQTACCEPTTHVFRQMNQVVERFQMLDTGTPHPTQGEERQVGKRPATKPPQPQAEIGHGTMTLSKRVLLVHVVGQREHGDDRTLSARNLQVMVDSHLLLEQTPSDDHRRLIETRNLKRPLTGHRNTGYRDRRTRTPDLTVLPHSDSLRQTSIEAPQATMASPSRLLPQCHAPLVYPPRDTRATAARRP